MITAIPAALWGAVIWEIPVTGRKYATGYGVIPWLIAELHIGGLEGWSLTHRFDPFGLVVLPFPTVGIGFAALSILRWYIKWGDRTGRCQNCAYHVQTSAARCPECGHAVQPDRGQLSRIHLSLLISFVLFFTVPGLLVWTILIVHWRVVSTIMIFGRGHLDDLWVLPVGGMTIMASACISVICLYSYRCTMRS